jgi:hypothetical protein
MYGVAITASNAKHCVTQFASDVRIAFRRQPCCIDRYLLSASDFVASEFRLNTDDERFLINQRGRNILAAGIGVYVPTYRTREVYRIIF